MPTCQNCGRTERFVLLADVAVGFRPGRGFDVPGVSLAIQCAHCASTDVAGDPAAVAASLLDGRTFTPESGRGSDGRSRR